MKTIRFLVFADFHYKKGMYTAVPADLDAVLHRAREADVACVIHTGDFCNDYAGSPEWTSRWLAADRPVYGCWGNHELETEGNTMENVTPCLSNDPAIIFGTADGKIGDGSIAYYAADRGAFRFVMLDTNYSCRPSDGMWEHNRPASWGAPAGNLHSDSLGPVQLAWLEGVLDDAAAQGLHCILVSHAGLTEEMAHSPDAAAVQMMIRRANATRRGTVLMCINGHYHTQHFLEREGVVYFDVNVAMNGYWKPQTSEHYTDVAPVYRFTDYDTAGNPTKTWDRPASSLTMGRNTHFFASPLSAIVTLGEDGSVSVRGSETTWLGGIVPETQADGVMPCIPDFGK